MSASEQDPQSARDAAIILPFVAGAVLVPPIVLIFTQPMQIAGVPLIVIYIFVVWALIILAAFLISRRVAGAEGESDGEVSGPPGRVDSQHVSHDGRENG